MTLLLTAAEVRPLLDWAKAISLTEEVFAEFGRGKVDVHAPFHLWVQGGALRVVAGALQESKHMGVRLGPTQGPPDAHVAVLYSSDGPLEAIMGYPFSTFRTAATVAVSIKHSARANARRLGLIGTGINALGQLKAARLVRDIGEIVVSSRDADRRHRFCEEATREVGIPVRSVDTMREAVSDMDIVITCSSARQPLFPFDWLKKGTHLASVGPISELDPDILLKSARRVVSSRTHEENYYIKTKPFPLVELIEAGQLGWDQVDELGEVVAGTKKGRASDDEITVFHESQGGFGDMVFAAWAYSEARKRGLGKEFAF
jgi:ornithine cyclodeaminase/alanine dehydrogenase-like protein (mu-crystallin family)